MRDLGQDLKEEKKKSDITKTVMSMWKNEKHILTLGRKGKMDERKQAFETIMGWGLPFQWWL